MVLEGGDASGKSTQSAILAESSGALLTREPGGTALGERVRLVLLDPENLMLDSRAETLLLLAARSQHVASVIEPALRSGRDVVCDRFEGSTLAYQGFGRGLDLQELATMSRWASREVVPDRVILLSLGAAEARARSAGREGRDRIESLDEDFFARVLRGYRTLASSDPRRWKVVDASGSVGEVAERVAAAAEGILSIGARDPRP